MVLLKQLRGAFFFFIQDNFLLMSNNTLLTCKTSVVVAVITRHIIPSVTMPGAKGVNAVFVFPVVGLSWSPEPKITYLFVCPHKGALHASVIESNPGSVSVMTVLNINIFLLVVYCHQIWTHGRAICFCGKPRRACGTCEVAITAKVTPSWVANI